MVSDSPSLIESCDFCVSMKLSSTDKDTGQFLVVSQGMHFSYLGGVVG